MSDALKDLRTSDPKSLSNLMHLDLSSPAEWSPDEFGAILRHQLAAPLQGELEGGRSRHSSEHTALARKAGIDSYRDLLLHAAPPVELLRRTKDHAKECREHVASDLPAEVATVLYFSTIAAARLRLGKRISALDDEALGKGLRWCLGLPWLDPDLRTLVGEALSGLTGRASRT